MGTHLVHATVEHDDPEAMKVTGMTGDVVDLGAEYTTDDAEEAAWVAERAAIAGLRPEVTTTYSDGLTNAEGSADTGGPGAPPTPPVKAKASSTASSSSS